MEQSTNSTSIPTNGNRLPVLFKSPRPKRLTDDWTDMIPQYKQTVLELILDILGDPLVVDYALRTIAQCLSPRKLNNEFYVWYGGMGKGVLRDLVKNIFGDHFSPMNEDYLIRRWKDNMTYNADPFMYSKAIARIVIGVEPDHKRKLSTDRILAMTSNTPITCGKWKSKPHTFTPNMNVVLQTNADLNIDMKCKELVDQIRVIRFPWYYVDNPTQPNEKRLNIGLKTTIQSDEYKIGFYHLLLEYYGKVMQDGGVIGMPDVVRDATNAMLARIHN
ncbi:D5 DNA Primase [uncultured virus]|nr:D5 DNA Primase [uncultured virus]